MNRKLRQSLHVLLGGPRPGFLELHRHLQLLFGSPDLDRVSAIARRRWLSSPSA